MVAGQSVTETLQDILRDAGRVLNDRFRRSVSYEEQTPHDLVTEVDRQVETILISRIRQVSDCQCFYSEEAGVVGTAEASRWILDPLDGTANFVFGVPHFGISVALEHQGQVVEAWVYNPVSEEMFHTSRDAGGSFLNGEPITVSDTSRWDVALVAFGFSATMENIRRYHEDWPDVFDRCRKGLGLLAPSLNICNVARGRIDAFIDFGSSMEGHAAAALVLQNAGGIARDYDGVDWDHTTRGIVATNVGLGVA